MSRSVKSSCGPPIDGSAAGPEPLGIGLQVLDPTGDVCEVGLFDGHVLAASIASAAVIRLSTRCCSSSLMVCHRVSARGSPCRPPR